MRPAKMTLITANVMEKLRKRCRANADKLRAANKAAPANAWLGTER